VNFRVALAVLLRINRNPGSVQKKAPTFQRKDGLCGIFFSCGETVPVHFEEQHANQESGALVSVHKRVIPTTKPRRRGRRPGDGLA
jgi:hypothetical protein